MKKFFLPAGIILLIVLGLFAYQERANLRSYFDFRGKLSSVSIPAELLKPLQEHGLLPEPLRSPESADSSSGAALTHSGTVKQTNAERAKFGLAPLSENAKLNQAASIKLKDMFDKQYFEHVSPDGKGPSDLANQVGYKYIVVGENLALGNFKNDSALLDAWMNSPGHRANILNERYTEIGVAVGKGTFDGKQTWLAVQSFGAPLSNCPQPDEQLKIDIATNQQLLTYMEADIEARKKDLEATKNNEEYNQKVAVYNQKVQEFNALIATTKQQVATYNAQVNTFNACVEG